jgi:transposase
MQSACGTSIWMQHRSQENWKALSQSWFYFPTTLITSAKCELEYLPPYSPDFNEIGHYWFPIKNRVRKSQGSIENFRERVDTSVRLSS